MARKVDLRGETAYYDGEEPKVGEVGEDSEEISRLHHQVRDERRDEPSRGREDYNFPSGSRPPVESEREGDYSDIILREGDFLDSPPTTALSEESLRAALDRFNHLAEAPHLDINQHYLAPPEGELWVLDGKPEVAPWEWRKWLGTIREETPEEKQIRWNREWKKSKE